MLGKLISRFNHSLDPNFTVNWKDKYVCVYTLKNVLAGEELCFMFRPAITPFQLEYSHLSEEERAILVKISQIKSFYKRFWAS